MQKSPNILDVRHKVHKNCWDCDNTIYGVNNCKCCKVYRRRKKRSMRHDARVYMRWFY